MTTMIDREHELIKDYTEKAIGNAEIFRSEAQMVHGRYNRIKRSQIKQLQSSKLNPYDVLIAWQDELAATLEELEKSRASSAFNKSISKYLQIEGQCTQVLIDQIVQQRRTQLNDQFIARFKHTGSKKAVEKLLDNSLRELHTLKDQYVRATISKMIAKEYDINFIDQHSPLPRRLIAMLKIKRERKLVNLQNKKRISEIDLRISEIEKVDDGLIGEIVRLRIDLVIILAARTNFEKRIARLTKDDALDASTRLEIFNEETRSIRNGIMKNVPGSLEMSLESVYAATKVTDKLLIRIFDLTNTQKNNLLVLTKEHRELREERDAIVRSQNERLTAIA